jgi:hypothetical protein
MTTTARRRIHIGAALAAVVLLTVTSTACQKDKAPAERTVTPPMTANMSFAGLPNGPAPSTYANGPVTISPRDVPKDPGSKFHIIDGKLTVDPATTESPASYFTTPNLGTPVVNIGAKWTFTRRGGSDGGAMGLVVSNTIFRPPFPIHLSVGTDKWGYGIWPPLDGEKIPDLIILDGGVFNPPLKDDGTTVYESEVTLDGDTATIRLPDGERRIVKDKRIAEWRGNYATFEAFAKNGLTDAVVGFTEIWTRRSPTG